MRCVVRAAVRAGVPFAALLLAGCGTGGGAGQSAPPSPGQAVARAAEKTEGLTSVHYRVTGQMPERGRLADEGFAATRPAVARLKTANLSGEDRGESELRLVDGVLYGSVPENQTKEAGGKHWVSYGPTARFRTASGLIMNVAWLRDQVGGNPAREAAFLAVADDVRRAGTETVDDVDTTHYTGKAGLDRLRASLRSEDKATRERGGRTLDEYGKLGVDELTLDVWIDGDNRIKRLRTQGVGRHGVLDLTCTFVEYGKPLTVEAPRPGDTLDLRKPRKGTAGGPP